jgi:hypothetical protein
MQVARNFFLSSERTLTRKVYEALLAFKIENNLSKDQILELYVNQIYLGQRAYGFAADRELRDWQFRLGLRLRVACQAGGVQKNSHQESPDPERNFTDLIDRMERIWRHTGLSKTHVFHPQSPRKLPSR